jgi:hypothetical protein
MSLYTYTLCKYTEEYFGRNLFEAFPAEVRPKDACLIIGGRGARSTLHADPFDWMGTNYCLEVLPILVATQLTKVVTDKVLFRGSKLHFNYSSDQLTTGLSTEVHYCLEERIDIYIYIYIQPIAPPHTLSAPTRLLPRLSMRGLSLGSVKTLSLGSIKALYTSGQQTVDLHSSGQALATSARGLPVTSLAPY